MKKGLVKCSFCNKQYCEHRNVKRDYYQPMFLCSDCGMEIWVDEMHLHFGNTAELGDDYLDKAPLCAKCVSEGWDVIKFSDKGKEGV